MSGADPPAQRFLGMISSRLILLSALAVAACGQSETNSPTDPAQPIDTPEASAPPRVPPPGVGPIMPGSGPQSFVGRWAADAAWCANTQGAERPIEITTTRFEGYENSCAITSLDEVATGYQAGLSCEAEGQTSTERVRMSVQGESLRLTWPDRNGAVVLLTRCPAPTAPG